MSNDKTMSDFVPGDAASRLHLIIFFFQFYKEKKKRKEE